MNPHDETPPAPGARTVSGYVLRGLGIFAAMVAGYLCLGFLIMVLVLFTGDF